MTAQSYAHTPSGISPVAPSRRASGVARPTSPFWKGAWKLSVLLTLLLVIRLAEFWTPLVYVRPAITAGLVTLFLLGTRSKPAAWRAATRDRAVRWSVVYMGAIVASMPFALWRGGTVPIMKLFLFNILLILTFVLCAPERRSLDRVLNWTVLGGAAMALLVAATGQIRDDSLGGARLGTVGMYDPNDLAAVLAVCLQLAIGMSFRTKGLLRLASFASSIVLLAVTLKTGSRGGTVALGVGTLVMLAALNARRFVMFTAALLIAIPVAWRFGPESFRVRTLSLLHIQDDYTFQANEGRINVWKRGMRYFIERPINGVGAGNYGEREGRYYTSAGIPGHWLTAHNTYVQVLVELGLLGAIPFGVLLVGAWRDSFRVWRRTARGGPHLYRPEIFVALVSFLTSAIFLSHAYASLTFFLCALCALTRRVVLAERAAQRPSGPTHTPTWAARPDSGARGQGAV